MTRPTRLPKWLSATRTMQFDSIDLTLAMALTLRIHGTADAIRQTARNMRHKVCMEHQPKVKLLAKLGDDNAVLKCAKNIVQHVTDQIGIAPGQPFEVLNLSYTPKCHYQPMLLTGEPGARLWRCQYCESTQPVEVIV